MSLAFTRRVLRIVKLEKEAADCEALKQPITVKWKRAKAQEIRDGPFTVRGEPRIKTTKQVFREHYGLSSRSPSELLRLGQDLQSHFKKEGKR